MSRLVPVLAGPTAVGKTSLAIELAVRLGADVVSADSRQIYRRLDVGTAKPTPAEQNKVRHRLIDVLEPGNHYSAADFARDARAEMDRMDRQGRDYIVAGGSGLYIKALVEGLSEMPPVDPEISRRLRQEAGEVGIRPLYRRLMLEDPQTAARLKPADRARIIRALEVLETTGRSISLWQGRPRQSDGRYYIIIVLNRCRSELYRRIDERAEDMLARGLVEEVEGLVSKGFRNALERVKAVGYREALSFLDGETDRSRMTDLIKQNTRRFAKRQLTWFRGMPGAEWLDAGEEADPAERVLELARRAGG